jgi:hypothetical protein
MKHILNDLSEEEKNSIREQHTGGMKVMTESFSKLINSKLGDSKPLVFEQTKDGVTYSVQSLPSGKFKIFATNATYKTPTDASKVFGGGSVWGKEYSTQAEAQKAIDGVVNMQPLATKPKGMKSTGMRSSSGRLPGLEEQMDVSSDSDYYKERQREVSIPFDDLSMLGSLASRFCSEKENLPDCKQVRRLMSRHNLFM